MTTKEVRIPISCKADVRAKFAKFQAKAAKLGCPAATLTFGEPVKVEVREHGIVVFSYLATVATVTGEVAKLAGWTFVAGLEHTPGGNLVRSIEGAVQLPESYRSVGPVCDHCGLNRDRLNTYVLVDEAGSFKQVGSTCLVDFLGIDPKNVLWFAESIASFDDDEDFGPEGRRAPGLDDIPLDAILAATARVIGAFGWASRKAAEERGGESTSDQVKSYLLFRDRDITKAIADITADPAEVAASIEWAKSLNGQRSDYEANIALIARNGVTNVRGFGYACSILPSYRRTVEQTALKAAQAPSSFVGFQGDKVALKGAKVVSVKEFPAYTYNGPLGLLVTMLVGDDIVKTFTNLGTAFGEFAVSAKDETFDIAATVKGQETYEGRKSTLLTRVKVTS